MINSDLNILQIFTDFTSALDTPYLYRPIFQLSLHVNTVRQEDKLLKIVFLTLVKSVGFFRPQHVLYLLTVCLH